MGVIGGGFVSISLAASDKLLFVSISLAVSDKLLGVLHKSNFFPLPSDGDL